MGTLEVWFQRQNENYITYFKIIILGLTIDNYGCLEIGVKQAGVDRDGMVDVSEVGLWGDPLYGCSAFT